eukprot:sb/3473004/
MKSPICSVHTGASRSQRGNSITNIVSPLIVSAFGLVWFGSLSRPGAMLSCSSCAVVEGTTMTPSASGRVLGSAALFASLAHVSILRPPRYIPGTPIYVPGKWLPKNPGKSGSDCITFHATLHKSISIKRLVYNTYHETFVTEKTSFLLPSEVLCVFK